MNYADIKKFDVANGPGIRVSLFVSGCTHACKGCFNYTAWDFNYGKPFTQETIDTIIKELSAPYYSGLTLLGGEPFEYVNQKGILPLLRQVREAYPDLSIWSFSGYTFDEEIMGEMYDKWPETREFLSYLEVLVDGEFVEDLKDLSLRFRGSSNQRIIDVQKSLQEDQVVLYEFLDEKK